ncbi:hypothetical protein [Providencia burhodogranariea]|uniref:Uncharacterized protein n=1 Tax=Providencia burhodogranariea DSM 19968 TaxID=1141662 RepID=K8WNX1_9GAMM|nr:hypothetical protein [Providencia burhodogranariea]EKT62269.1 hypothetical protein OOA_08472 [Providencia burhodogranariea DSM 19968]
MISGFASLIKISFLFLLSFDCKARAILSKICWFVPISSLENDESTNDQQLDIDISTNWSQLWLSAQKLCVSLCSNTVEIIENKVSSKQLTSLKTRKRYELLFLSLVSSLRQLMACRHSSGAPGNIDCPLSKLLKAQCAFLPLCFFIT